MTEKIYLGILLVLFILSFALKNVITYFKTKQPVFGRSKKIALSVSISSIIYIIILSRLIFLDPKWILEIIFPGSIILKAAGMILTAFGFLSGILSFFSIKDSWRVAIKHDQKTELITVGIYKFCRNPYFLSYEIFFLGYILYFPSLILISLYLPLIVIFHKIILDEEKFLETAHGEVYISFKQKVKRYLIL